MITNLDGARASALRWVSGHPLDLSAFRITVMMVVLGAIEVHQAPRYAELAPLLRSPPWGFTWAAELVPHSPTQAEVLKWLLLAAAACSLIGLFTRLALCTTTALLLVVLALPQQWGAGVHTHHLLWFSALLMASPSGDALSVDAWMRRRKGMPTPGHSPAYGLPVRAAWISIGLVFLFPGLWKWHAQGLDWALSDNLVHQLRFKWLEHGELPAMRLDQYPALLKVGGVGVLLFEVSLLPLLLWRRTRLLGVGAMLGFHAATQVFFFIGFSSLWACYTVFLPWSRWLRAPAGTDVRRWAWPGALAALFVLCGQVAAGAMVIEHGWPFGCYPTFRFDPGEYAPVLVTEEELKDGSRRELAPAFLRGVAGQREWSEMWHLLRAPEPTRLLEWWRTHRRGDDRDVQRVIFFRGALSADPAAWSVPARRDAHLLTVEPR